MIAMTMSDEPILACSPISLMPSANIVGNMIDMKKLVAPSAMTAAMPAAPAATIEEPG